MLCKQKPPSGGFFIVLLVWRCKTVALIAGGRGCLHYDFPRPISIPRSQRKACERQQELRMETQELHRGRLIDHLQLVVQDLPASQRFYTAILAALEVPIGGTGDGYFWADELFVSTANSQAAQGALTGRHHLAFQARDRAMVERFYQAALAHGGKDNGAPGERAYHPGYYAAFVLDPDGNNIEAVYHGEAQRSAASVHIQFEG